MRHHRSYSRGHESDLRSMSIGMISTYPPTRCGIGRFAASLVAATRQVAPNTEIGIARVVDTGDSITARHDRDVSFDPLSATAARAVGRRMNAHDVVLLQHEYGLYGPNDGAAVLDLVSHIRVPLVTVLHTVVADPTPRQHSIILHLAERGRVVVPTEAARLRLNDRYAVDPGEVEVIPHGASWTPSPTIRHTRRRLVTWGLLGPGKGIERALRAVARLDMRPEVTYDIVGQTHPKVFRTLGTSYRAGLEDQAAALGIAGRVRFVERYLDDDELFRAVTDADVVVIPYDNSEQICSGVLIEAIAAGRPVVATGFPHAVEALADGAGAVTEHDDGKMAEAIYRLLVDDDAYADATDAARRAAPALSWSAVAARYLEVAVQAIAATSAA